MGEGQSRHPTSKDSDAQPLTEKKNFSKKKKNPFKKSTNDSTSPFQRTGSFKRQSKRKEWKLKKKKLQREEIEVNKIGKLAAGNAKAHFDKKWTTGETEMGADSSWGELRDNGELKDGDNYDDDDDAINDDNDNDVQSIKQQSSAACRYESAAEQSRGLSPGGSTHRRYIPKNAKKTKCASCSGSYSADLNTSAPRQMQDSGTQTEIDMLCNPQCNPQCHQEEYQNLLRALVRSYSQEFPARLSHQHAYSTPLLHTQTRLNSYPGTNNNRCLSADSLDSGCAFSVFDVTGDDIPAVDDEGTCSPEKQNPTVSSGEKTTTNSSNKDSSDVLTYYFVYGDIQNLQIGDRNEMNVVQTKGQVAETTEEAHL